MSPTAAPVEDLLLSPAYVESPYATYELLRRQHPVYWCEKWNGWVVSCYDDVLAVLQDFRRFSNRGRYTEYLSSLAPEERSQLKYLEHHYEHGGLVQSDPPEHNRLRKLANAAFTPRIVAQMEPLVRQIVANLIDGFADADEVELVRQFAFPLPAIVIAGILGVPQDERDRFKDWSAKVQRFLGSGTVDFQYALEAQDSWQQMNNYFAELLKARRKDPQNDLVSGLAHACEDGERLSEDEVIRSCGAMLIAGHETTTNLIASGVWRLLGDLRQKELLEDDPTLYPAAIEEVLRLETPFQSAPRKVVEDAQIGGKSLKKGDLVYVMLGSANRDPNQFPDPDAFDLHRRDNKHLAFGYGIHFCLGAALARLEGPIALETLFQRFPNMRLDAARPPVWKKSMVQRGMEEFWLKL